MTDAKQPGPCSQCGASPQDYGRGPEILSAAKRLEVVANDLLHAVDATLATGTRLDVQLSDLLEMARRRYITERTVYREVAQ